MAAQIFYDHLASVAKVIDTATEHSVESEILLADYDPPVFKIVKTTMEHLVTQKYIMHNKLTVEGFIKITVYYQPPESNKLASVTQKLPFQKQFDVQPGEWEASIIRMDGQCQYVNTRPQNSTRIDVRGAYVFSVKALCKSSSNIVTAIKGENICCDMGEIEHFGIVGQNNRRFTTENEVNLPEDIHKIIRVTTSAQDNVTTLYSDKVTSKGNINADIYYTTSNSDGIKKYTQSFPYNQIIDIPGTRENNIQQTDVAVSALGITKNSESNKYTASLTAQIDVCTFAKQQVMAVGDVFSRKYNYTSETGVQMCDTNIYSVDKNISGVLTEKLGNGYTVYDVILEASPVKSYFEVNKTISKFKLSAHIIALNNRNEYECFTANEDIVVESGINVGQYDEVCLNPQIESYTVVQGGEDVKIEVALNVKGFIVEKQPLMLVKNFEETEQPIENNDEAMILYYASKGERVFEIAKNHNADPQLIISENSLQNDVINSKGMLFITAFTE